MTEHGYLAAAVTRCAPSNNAGNGSRDEARLFGRGGYRAGGSKHEWLGKVILQAVITETAHALGIQPLPDLITRPGAFGYGLPNLPFRHRVTYTHVHSGTFLTCRSSDNTKLGNQIRPGFVAEYGKQKCDFCFPHTNLPGADLDVCKTARRVCAMDGAHQNQCLTGIDFGGTSLYRRNL